MKQSKFDRIRKWLNYYWGFGLRRNDSSAHGWYEGDWKTGYTVSGNLRGSFMTRYNSLAEIERSWLMEDYKEKP